MRSKLLQSGDSKTVEVTGDFIANKIVNKITKVSKIHNKIIQRHYKWEW